MRKQDTYQILLDRLLSGDKFIATTLLFLSHKGHIVLINLLDLSF